jgi:hypothetical protein
MRGRFIAIDRENYFLDERPQELLLIARRRRRCVPDRGEVGSEGEKAIAFFLAENAGALLQSAGEFFVRRPQTSALKGADPLLRMEDDPASAHEFAIDRRNLPRLHEL